MVAEATVHTETVLVDNYQSLEKVSCGSSSHTMCLILTSPPPPQLAEALLEREVLNYPDIVELLGPLPYQKTHLHSQDLSDMW